MATAPYTERAYVRGRARLLAAGPACAHCGRRPATEADHAPPLSRHRHVAGSGCCQLLPSCAACARLQGGVLRAGPHTATPVPATPVDPDDGYPVDDPVWAVAWLADLRDVPGDATWPRLMTRPHPAAVDSYGDAVTAAAARRGVTLRWWQRLVAARLLEHDADGNLCWREAFVSTARQVGKSVLLRELCQWRLDAAGELFDPGQLIVHTGRNLAVSVEVQRPARIRAHRDPGYKVRETNGEQMVERVDDGSRWAVRSIDNLVSLTADMVVIDEAWDVEAVKVETDLVPTMIERPNAQFVLWSTAHREATSLVMNRRTALDVTNTGRGLHVEWSAPRGVELDDRAGWRAASPQWSALREQVIAERLDAARAGHTADPTEPDPFAAFTSQYLNWWPTATTRANAVEALLDPGAWAACEGALTDPKPAAYVALESYFGKGGAVGFAVGDDAGRFEIDGVACESWDAAIGLAGQFVTNWPQARVIVGAAFVKRDHRADIANWSTRKAAGPAETGPALALLRALVAAGRVVHDDTPDLDDQVVAARVKATPTGGLVLHGGEKLAVLRAALWALYACQTPAPTPAIH